MTDSRACQRLEIDRCRTTRWSATSLGATRIRELSVLLSKVSTGLTSLQISASRATPEELPEPVGAEQTEDVPKLEGFTED